MDLFSTNYLTGLVNSLQIPPQFLLAMFFGGIQTEASEEIHFDVENDVMGLAPFVSPVVAGQIMTNQGYTTKTFKPAYVKPKNVWNPNQALKRSPGEQIGGILTPEQRMQLLVATTLQAHRKMVARRLEWMAAAILATGKVTISGEQYQTVEVNFGRDAALTTAPSTAWGQAGANPLNDLQTWSDLCLQKSGSAVRDWVMEVDAWKLFRADADVKARLDLQRALSQTPTMDQGAIRAIGGTFRGTIDGFNVWTYAGYYKAAADGAVTPMLASGTVLGVGDMGGVQAYGAIQDERAGLQALPYFSKSWLEEDPARRLIMTQSAPLLVPYRPNASFMAKVN